MNQEAIQIRTQVTPNPNARKYILSKDVKAEGKVSFTDEGKCSHVPLAVALLRLANVTQVHFFENVITVTQNGASDWQVLSDSVGDVVRIFGPSHDPNFQDQAAKAKPDRSTLSSELLKIEEILDHAIRPSLQADGGDVEVLELDGNIITVRYQGACGGCPSSMMGTLQAIESVLRSEFNPYVEVVAI